MSLTDSQRQRKINKLSRIRIELSAESNNPSLSRADRMNLARASDALNDAIKAMGASR